MTCLDVSVFYTQNILHASALVRFPAAGPRMLKVQANQTAQPLDHVRQVRRRLRPSDCAAAACRLPQYRTGVQLEMAPGSV